MASDPVRYFTVEQYLALLKAEGPIVEYWDGDILMMSGGSPQHIVISNNVWRALTKTLQEPCVAWGEGTPIETPTLPTFRFPDCAVLCGAPVFKVVDGSGIITNPTLIVEVISRTSAAFDRNRKFEAYKVLASFREYLLVEQDRQQVTQWWMDSLGEWHSRIITEGKFSLESVQGELDLADLYRGLEDIQALSVV